MKLLGAIIAGGASRRFGGDKGAALLNGRALIDHVRDALTPQVDALVISGRRWPGLIMVADRPAPDLGPLGGLCGALRHAEQHGYDALLTAGCDVLPVPPLCRHPELVSGSIAKQRPAVFAWEWMLKQACPEQRRRVQHDGIGESSVVMGQPLFGFWPARLAEGLEAHLATQTDRSMRHWIAVSGAREVPYDTHFHNLNTRADFALYSAGQGLAA